MTTVTKVSADQKNGSSVVFGPVRFSYLNVFEPRMHKQKKRLQYSASLLIPKKPVEGFCEDPKKLVDFIKAQSTDAITKLCKGVPPKYADWVLQDGDTVTNDLGVPKFPGYWFINASSEASRPPAVIDNFGKEITDHKSFLSGHWGMAKIDIYAMENSDVPKGVYCKLLAVQKKKEDETFAADHDSFESKTSGFEMDEELEDFLA